MGDDTKLPDLDAISDPAELRSLMSAQQDMIVDLQAQLAEMRSMLFGKSSERMPPIEQEVRKRRIKKGKKGKKADYRLKTRQKRRKRQEQKCSVPTEEVLHPVAESELHCPHCHGARFGELGDGEISFEWEYVPGRFVRFKHVQQKKACSCGGHVVTAAAPPRVSDGVKYGPGFHAHTVVAKMGDAIPFYRLAKRLSREGIPISRSTLCDIFHRCASLLAPLHARMLELVAIEQYVNADETPLRVQAKGKTRRAYIWDFISDKLVVYVYSPGRSGQTPVDVLGDSAGFLQVDGYSGYNSVTVPGQRIRVGCWAHARRYFWKALETEPELSRWVLDKIVELYEVEYDAAEQEVLGTERHLSLRRARSGPILRTLERWLTEQAPQHPPKGQLGKAITYARNNWESLSVFLEDARLSLDNNVSERQLRIVALGRKNFLFVGHDAAGENLAVLQSLVASCDINGVNPEAYLTDVLMRVQTHPHSALDELLPHRWQPPADPVGEPATP